MDVNYLAIYRRWVFWVMTAFAGFCFLQIVFTLPETYEPVLLLEKAKRLRKETGDQNYYAPLEKGGRVSFAERLNNVLRRPFAILIHEPMLIVITIYMSFVYGCLYLLFEAYPIAFTEGHHFNAGISGLMFLPLPIGGMFAVITVRFRSAIFSTPCPDISVHSTCSFSTRATSAPLSSTHQTQSPLKFAWK